MKEDMVIPQLWHQLLQLQPLMSIQQQQQIRTGMIQPRPKMHMNIQQQLQLQPPMNIQHPQQQLIQQLQLLTLMIIQQQKVMKEDMVIPQLWHQQLQLQPLMSIQQQQQIRMGMTPHKVRTMVMLTPQPHNQQQLLVLLQQHVQQQQLARQQQLVQQQQQLPQQQLVQQQLQQVMEMVMTTLQLHNRLQPLAQQLQQQAPMSIQLHLAPMLNIQHRRRLTPMKGELRK